MAHLGGEAEPPRLPRTAPTPGASSGENPTRDARRGAFGATCYQNARPQQTCTTTRACNHKEVTFLTARIGNALGQ